MKKALMYLLLALGIMVAVALVSGAVMGFVAGFIDGYNESSPGTIDTKTIMLSSGMVLMILTCLVLNIVFLRLRYASYTVGHIPQKIRWKVVVWVMLAMAGMALIYCMMWNPLTDSDEAVRSYFVWMKEHPFVSLILCAFIEGTADLILFGGVLREILTWKHRPEIVIPVFGAVMGLISGLFSHPLLIVPAMMVALIEGWTYEYSRSVIPVIIGDTFYWALMLMLMGTTFPWWCLTVGGILVGIGIYMALHTMEPYKPID